VSGMPYSEAFPVGTQVRVRDLAELERFRAGWRYHHPLSDVHLEYAGAVARVTSIGFFHGGDPLYELEGVPGMWHETCLGEVH
jgi:hypothetical protein